MKRIFLFFMLLCGITISSFSQSTSTSAAEYIQLADKAIVWKADSAIIYYKKAIELSPELATSDLYLKLATRYFRLYGLETRLSRTDSAILYFKKAASADPNNDLAWRGVGDCFQRFDKPDSAMLYYFKAINAPSSNVYAYWEIVNIFRAMNKPASVLYYTQRLLDVFPDYRPALMALASWHENTTKNIDSALYYYNKVLPGKYTNGMAKERIAFLTMQINKNDTLPLVYFTQMLNEWPSAWRQYYNLACYYANRGDADNAISFLKKAMERGMKNKEQLYAEPLFASIRTTNGFKELEANYLL